MPLATAHGDVRSIVVMGVSGCGKTTLGAALAERLEMPFVDADGLHPARNVAKMTSGTPLSDEDRWPWLDTVGTVLATASTVVACSALRRAYRNRLRNRAGEVWFLELSGTKELLAERLDGRSGHFMPRSLLDSQLQTLEDLDETEAGLIIDIATPVTTIVDAVADTLTGQLRGA